jgi:hypothetical protein
MYATLPQGFAPAPKGALIAGFEKGVFMQATAVLAAPEEVRAFIQEYFDAWKGTDAQNSRLLFE